MSIEALPESDYIIVLNPTSPELEITEADI